MPSYQEINDRINRAAESFVLRIIAISALLRAAEEAGLPEPVGLTTSCWSVAWMVQDKRNQSRRSPHYVEVFGECKNNYTIFTGAFGRQYDLTLAQVIGLVRDGIKDNDNCS
jgi:hypothetical protein